MSISQHYTAVLSDLRYASSREGVRRDMDNIPEVFCRLGSPLPVQITWNLICAAPASRLLDPVESGSQRPALAIEDEDAGELAGQRDGRVHSRALALVRDLDQPLG